MKFVIAPDSFKGGLTASQVADAIQTGLKRVYPTANYTLVPMADGGEGTVDALVHATHGRQITTTVTGPLGTPVSAHFGLLGNGRTAVIEMAEASGFQHVPESKRNPLITTTYGTGELISKALDHHVDQIIIGIGGSATNDGGAGMAQALGVELLDLAGNQLPFGGGHLNDLAAVNLANRDSRLDHTRLLIACDVTNPLVDPTGASVVFGPQKGASPSMVATLDHNLRHYAAVIHQTIGRDVATVPGAGAAGGLGAGLLAFTNANLKRGVDLVIQYSGLKDKAAGADFIFTGEGKIDRQTQFGKTPYGVALAAKKVAPNAPVIAIAGNVGSGINSLYQSHAIDAIFTSVAGVKTLDDALLDASHDIAQVAENIARLIQATMNK